MSTTASAPASASHGLPRILIAVGASIAIAIVSFLATGALRPGAPALMPPAGSVTPSPIVQNPALMAKYGILLKQVGLTGDGGLVDVRIEILDPLKASPVVGHHAVVAMVLGDERAGKLLDTRAMTPGDSQLVAGQSYYILFRNASGVIRRGDWLDVFVGSYEIKHVRVV